MNLHDVGKHLVFDDWPSLRDQLLEDAEPGLVWRGMANAEWPVHTSLDRFRYDNHLSGQLRDRSRVTATLLQQYGVLSRELGLPDAQSFTEDQFWALGQHWGLPTPFLDWSRSPMVAAYFAITGTDPNATPEDRMCCIYRLNYEAPEFADGDIRRVRLDQGPWNARLRAQQGVFTSSADETCLVKKLQSLGYEHQLFAYVFPYQVAKQIFADLDAMTIDDVRMYPDHLGAIRQARTTALRLLETQ